MLYSCCFHVHLRNIELLISDQINCSDTMHILTPFSRGICLLYSEFELSIEFKQHNKSTTYLWTWCWYI